MHATPNGKRTSVPAWYEIDNARRVVMSTGSGHLTAADILAHQQKLLNDPDFDPSFSQFVDFSAVTASDITADEVRAIAAATVFSPTSCRAVLVNTDEQFGLARMFGMVR
jgi:hypothetical protein